MYGFKEIFLKNLLMIILPTSCTHRNTTICKKIIKVDHKIQGCVMFGQIGVGKIFGKLTIVTFVNLLYSIILKCSN